MADMLPRSRLVSRAPRPSRCDAGFHHGLPRPRRDGRQRDPRIRAVRATSNRRGRRDAEPAGRAGPAPAPLRVARCPRYAPPPAVRIIAAATA